MNYLELGTSLHQCNSDLQHISSKLLGAPIGDSEYCSQFFSKKHQAALALLSTHEEIGSTDPFCHSFANCTGVDTSDTAWKQAKMSLHKGGLGLRTLADHSLRSVQATPHLDKSHLSA